MESEKIWSGAIESESVAVLQLDPARVCIWKGNARVYDRLTEENTRDLIDSIDASGQQFPAIVRQIDGDANFDYELIAGSRRHFAVSWLRAHGRELRLLAQLSNLGDEAAFNLSDTENRARQDVSDLERARNYAWALKAIYNGSLGAMADSMKISKGWLSRMITVSKIPDEVLAPFNSPLEVKMKPAYALAQTLADNEQASGIRKAARNLAHRQAELCESGKAPIPAQEVMTLLLDKPPKPAIAIWRGGRGSVYLPSRGAHRLGGFRFVYTRGPAPIPMSS